MPVLATMYFKELTKAMTWLSKQPKTLFVGQAVAYAGQAAFKSFDGVPENKRLELPVMEDFQMGFCTGLALEGIIPISFYPRFDFLLMACNQLINHLDKIPLISDYKPKMVIRTAVGSTKPLDPGPQHTQNYTRQFRQMMQTIPVFELHDEKSILKTYQAAFDYPGPVVVVEFMEKYRQ